MKKILLPIISASLLLSACGSNDKVLLETKEGKTTQSEVYKTIDRTEIGRRAFELAMLDIFRDKYSDNVKEKQIASDSDNDVKTYGGYTAFKQYMYKNLGITTTAADYKQANIFNAYQEAMLNDKMPISDKEFKENTRNISHILFTGKNAKADAEKALTEIKAGTERFEDVALEQSKDSQSAKNAGALGYIYKGQVDPDFEKQAFKLKDNEISNVIRTDFGYHILKNNGNKSFEDNKLSLKSQYRQYLLDKDPKKLMDMYKKLLKEYDVKYTDKDVESYITKIILTPPKNKQVQEDKATENESVNKKSSTEK